MPVSVRPFATAGVALAAVGVLAVAPAIAPTPPDIQIPKIAAAQVALTAEADFFGRWVETFNTTSDNASALSQFYFDAPGAALQQAIVNQVGYLGDVLNDPAGLGAVFQSIGDNMEKAFQFATMQGLPDDINDPGLIPVLALSNDASHTLIAALMPSFLPEGTPEFVTPLVHFVASPVSGVLIGFAGPLVSPGVAALNSIMGGDLLNLPANVVDGFFNGATLDLDALLPVINGAGVLPEGTTFAKLGIAFGGLLSPGTTANTVPVGEVVGEGGIGGSIFSSLDLAITTDALGFPFTLSAPGVAVGPIGALANLSQITAGALGWDGDGNPLTHLTFPKLKTEPATDPLQSLGIDTSATRLALSTGEQATGSAAGTANDAAIEKSGQDEGETQVVSTVDGSAGLARGSKVESGKGGSTSSDRVGKLRTAVKEARKDFRVKAKEVRTSIRDAVKGKGGRADKAGANDGADNGAGADKAGANDGAGKADSSS